MPATPAPTPEAQPANELEKPKVEPDSFNESLGDPDEEFDMNRESEEDFLNGDADEVDF